MDEQQSPNQSPPEILAELLRAKRLERLGREAEKRSGYISANPIASALGDCDRQMALNLICPEVRPPFRPEGVENMESGNRQEDAVIRDLQDEGWRIVEQQAPFRLRNKAGRIILSGKMEGKLQWEHEGKRLLVPFEIKDTSQYMFEALQCEEDLKRSQWTRKWWRQIQSYLIGHNFEWAILFTSHRGKRNPIPIRLDYAEGERILLRCEATVEVSDLLVGTPHDKIDHELNLVDVPYCGDAKVCTSCDFYQRVCFPPVKHALQGEIAVKPELAEKVSRLMELRPAVKEHGSLERQLEKEAPRGSHVAAGDWLITGRWEEQNTKAVEAQPAKPAGTRAIWKREYLRSDGTPAEKED